MVGLGQVMEGVCPRCGGNALVTFDAEHYRQDCTECYYFFQQPRHHGMDFGPQSSKVFLVCMELSMLPAVDDNELLEVLTRAGIISVDHNFFCSLYAMAQEIGQESLDSDDIGPRVSIRDCLLRLEQLLRRH
jgi:ribosomal protein S27AE